MAAYYDDVSITVKLDELRPIVKSARHVAGQCRRKRPSHRNSIFRKPADADIDIKVLRCSSQRLVVTLLQPDAYNQRPLLAGGGQTWCKELQIGVIQNM